MDKIGPEPTLMSLAQDVAADMERDVLVHGVRALEDNPNLAIVLASRRMPEGYEHLRYCTWLMNAYDIERPFFAHGVYDLGHDAAMESFRTRR